MDNKRIHSKYYSSDGAMTVSMGVNSFWLNPGPGVPESDLKMSELANCGHDELPAHVCTEGSRT